jgi:hypothetical protein
MSGLPIVVRASMDDLTCPKCRVGVQRQPKRGSRHDFKCPSCHLEFSVSGSDWPAITAGASTSLGRPDLNSRIWLRPHHCAALPQRARKIGL